MRLKYVSYLRSQISLSNTQMSKLTKAIILIALILFIDQALKIYIKSTMFLGQEHNIIGNWFIIHFTENNGMAYGMELGGNFGKIALSIFRIIAVGFIGYYLYKLSKLKERNLGYMLSIGGIFAGALGNILDSLFYGVMFSDSYYRVAEIFPKQGGYAPVLYGKVVDMFYFPIINGHFPEWFPIWGSEQFIFFRPVFNIADASITVSVITIILFFRKNISSKS